MNPRAVFGNVIGPSTPQIVAPVDDDHSQCKQNGCCAKQDPDYMGVVHDAENGVA